MALFHEMGVFLKVDVFAVFQHKNAVVGEQVVVEDQAHQLVVALAFVRRVGKHQIVLHLVVPKETEHVRADGDEFLHVESQGRLPDELDTAEVEIDGGHLGAAA